jgi:hypothetical protein
MGIVELRYHGAQHSYVVAGLERRREQQCAATRLTQRELEFARPVRRIDIDQNETDPRGGEHRQHPLGIVRGPDADACAGHQPASQKAVRNSVDGRGQLAERVAQPLMTGDERGACRPAFGGIP